jgi:hypothetical protein
MHWNTSRSLTMKHHGTTVVCALAFLTACASATNDIAVESEAGLAADFSRYQTYYWDAATTVLNDPDGRWSAPGFNALEFVVAQVDTALQERGWTLSATDPDLLASIGTGINMEFREGADGTDSTKLANVPKGALVLALVDNASGGLVWMGTATGNVQDAPDDDTVRKRLEYAVAQLMKQLPE